MKTLIYNAISQAKGFSKLVVPTTVDLQKIHAHSEPWLSNAGSEVSNSINVFFNNKPKIYGYHVEELGKIEWRSHFASKGNRSREREKLEVLLGQNGKNIVTVSNEIDCEFEVMSQVVQAIGKVGYQSRHSRVTGLKQFLRFYGLDVTKPSTPQVTDSFKENVIGWIEGLGEFPSQAVSIKKNKTQGSRQMLSGICTKCGNKVYATRGQLESKIRNPLAGKGIVCGNCNIPFTFKNL